MTALMEALMKSPCGEKLKEKVKCGMFFGLIAFGIHPYFICFSSDVALCNTGQSVGLGADEWRETVCQRKGIVRIHRFHFDQNECSADAVFLFGLQGDRGRGWINV